MQLLSCEHVLSTHMAIIADVQLMSSTSFCNY